MRVKLQVKNCLSTDTCCSEKETKSSRGKRRWVSTSPWWLWVWKMHLLAQGGQRGAAGWCRGYETSPASYWDVVGSVQEQGCQPPPHLTHQHSQTQGPPPHLPTKIKDLPLAFSSSKSCPCKWKGQRGQAQHLQRSFA